MNNPKLSFRDLFYDLPAALVVFLVALPLCLGIALASGAPLFSGIISGIVGGIIVGAISGSHVSVSGPAAGLTAVVLASIAALGNYQTFLAAVFLGGCLQIIFSCLKAGFIADFFPSNVIKGLLAAIGIILIMKQIPHALGYDSNPLADFDFVQVDGDNTLSHLFSVLRFITPGPAIIGIVSIILLISWDKSPLKKYYFLPAPLVVVVVAIILNELFAKFSPFLKIESEHLVSIPVSSSLAGFISQFTHPDFSALYNLKTYSVAATLAIVASLETLLNLEAVDKMDPHKRHSPPNRELFAQGVGNVISGLIGGIPVTSVIVRSSVNLNAGSRSKLSAILHGFLLLTCALIIPNLLNKIPLASLAGILLTTGFKLAKPSLFISEYRKGLDQFLPFIATILAIVFTDLLTGIIVGLAISVIFILKSNFRNPFDYIHESYHAGEIIRIELAQQVSFLNKASIIETLDALPENSQVIIDASGSDYIDFDIIELIEEFHDVQAPERGIELSLLGFKDRYTLKDKIRFTTTVTQELQQKLSPQQVLGILKEGNERFLRNKRVNRDLITQVQETSNAQHPIAAVLGCIDSRTTSELIFDLGLGEIFNVRIAGNIANEDIIGSLEFACKIAGAKLILVLGHTNCGAIKAACDNIKLGNLTHVIEKIAPAVTLETQTANNRNSTNKEFVKNVTFLNVEHTKQKLIKNSEILASMLQNREILIVGAIYDVGTGSVSFDTKIETNNSQFQANS